MEGLVASGAFTSCPGGSNLIAWLTQLLEKRKKILRFMENAGAGVAAGAGVGAGIAPGAGVAAGLAAGVGVGVAARVGAGAGEATGRGVEGAAAAHADTGGDCVQQAAMGGDRDTDMGLAVIGGTYSLLMHPEIQHGVIETNAAQAYRQRAGCTQLALHAYEQACELRPLMSKLKLQTVTAGEFRYAQVMPASFVESGCFLNVISSKVRHFQIIAPGANVAAS